MRRGYSGTGGPLTPMSFSTMGGEPDQDTLRANVDPEPPGRDQPLPHRGRAGAVRRCRCSDAYRFTSGFGPRWGRMHEGTDFAGPVGTPVYSTADGVVTHAGWSSGYGRLIKIQHEFGIETRYGHLNAIAGQGRPKGLARGSDR